MSKTRVRLVAELDPDLYRRVKIQAINEGVSIKHLAEKVFIRYLGAKKEPGKSKA